MAVKLVLEPRDEENAKIKEDRDYFEKVVLNLQMEIIRLKTERDRLVVGCRATADWLDDLLPRGDWIELVNYSDGVRAKVAELRRLFLPQERFGDGDSIADRYGPEED